MGAFRLSESDVVEDVAPVGRMRLSPTDTVEDVAAPAPTQYVAPPGTDPYEVSPAQVEAMKKAWDATPDTPESDPTNPLGFMRDTLVTGAGAGIRAAQDAVYNNTNHAAPTVDSLAASGLYTPDQIAVLRAAEQQGGKLSVTSESLPTRLSRQLSEQPVAPGHWAIPQALTTEARDLLRVPGDFYARAIEPFYARGDQATEAQAVAAAQAAADAQDKQHAEVDKNRSWAHGAVEGTAQSVAQFAKYMPLGPAALYPMVGEAGLRTFLDTKHKAELQNLPPEEADRHGFNQALWEMGPEAVSNIFGMPGLERGLSKSLPALKRIWESGAGKIAARAGKNPVFVAGKEVLGHGAGEVPTELVTATGQTLDSAETDPANAPKDFYDWVKMYGNVAAQSLLGGAAGGVLPGIAKGVEQNRANNKPLPTAAAQNASKPDLIPAADILAQYGPEVAANVGPGLTPAELADRLNSRTTIDTATLPGATVRPDGQVDIFPPVPPAGPVSEGPTIDPAAAQQGDPEAVAALVARTKAQTAQAVAAERAQQNTPLRQYYVDLIRQGATPEEARAKVAARQAEIDPALQRAADVVNGAPPTPIPEPTPAPDTSQAQIATGTVPPSAVPDNQPTETPSDAQSPAIPPVAPVVVNKQDVDMGPPPAGPGRGPGADGTGEGAAGDGAQAQAAGKFTLSSTGTENLGRVNVEDPKGTGIVNAPIRYESDSRGHIAPVRLKQIQAAGYANDVALVEDVAQNHNRIYEGKDGTLLLAKKNGKAKVAFVEIIPDASGEYYRVNTSFVARDNYLKNKAQLWERAQTNQAGVITPDPPSAVTGQSGAKDIVAETSRPVSETERRVLDQAERTGANWYSEPQALSIADRLAAHDGRPRDEAHVAEALQYLHNGGMQAAHDIAANDPNPDGTTSNIVKRIETVFPETKPASRQGEFRFSSTEAPTATQNAPTDAPTPAQQHIMRRAVQYVATAMGKAFPNGNRIVVFDDVAGLPEHLRAGFQAEKTRVGEEGEVHGEFDGDRNSPTYGTTFLHRPDIIRRAKREGISVEYATERTILHETGTHYGSDVLFGGADMRVAHLNRVYNARAAEVDPYNEAGTDRTARAKLVEEWLTPRIEAATTPEGWKRLTNADKGLLRPVWQGVRRVLRKAGLLRSYNDFEINALAHAMYTGVAKGRAEAVAGYEDTFGRMDAPGATETAVDQDGARYSHASAYDERPEGSAVRGLNFKQGKPDAAMRRQQARDRELSGGARFSSTRRDGDRHLAPNGKPSNLSRGQHKQVRTEAFKRWGGDWEGWAKRLHLESMLAITVDPAILGNTTDAGALRDAATKHYMDILRGKKPATNKFDKKEISFSRAGIRETRQHSADARVMQIVPYLRELLTEAVPLYSENHKPESKTDNVKAWHYYATPVEIGSGGERQYVRLVVKEDANGNRYFDNDVTSVDMLTKQESRSGQAVRIPNPGPAQNDFPIHSLPEWWHSVNRPSVLLDENGEPKVVYHGTDQDFTVFDGKRWRFSPTDGIGSFFSDDPAVASSHAVFGDDATGANVKPVYLSMRDPLIVNGTQGVPPIVIWESGKAKNIMEARKGGHDGIIVDNGQERMYVPFAPEQIKSSIGNRGTFDPANPDIRHSSYSPNRGLRVQDIPQPVALPELTNLTRDLLGSAPGILERLRIRGGRALGVFHGTEGANTPAGRVDLKADIFVGPQIAARRTRAMATKDEMDAFRDDILKASNVNPDELVIRRAKNGKTFGLIAYARDHNYAAQILGHEIGHAADWLEEGSLKRGNILGHIAALHKYMSSTVGAVNAAMTPEQRADMRKDVEKSVRAAGTPSSDKAFSGMVAKEMRARIAAKGLFDKGEIRDELKALTHWWSPFDADNVPDSYKSYRYSAPELYAEALSVMFNNPEQLTQRAPRFWEAFNEFADARPEVKAVLDAIQSEIKAGNTPAARLARERQAMAMDEKRRAEIAGERAKDSKARLRDLPKALAWAAWDNTVYVPKAAKQAMQDIAYSGSNAMQYFRDVDAKALKILRDADVDLEDFGVFVKNRRAAHERADLANPGGIRGADAEALLDTLRADVGPAKYAAIEKAATGVFEARKQNVFGVLEKSGLFNEELMDKIRTNEEYFKFQVQEYLDAKSGGPGNGTAHIYHQIGTLKDVSNPLYPTITQDLSLIHAALTNTAKREIVAALSGTDALTEAKRGANGEWMNPPDGAQGLLVLAEDGVQKGYYVDGHIADLFKHDPMRARVLWNVLQVATVWPKRILTSNNPLFGLWNVTRDFQSSVVKLPGNPITAAPKLLWNYAATARDAARHAFMKESTDRVSRMMQDGELIAGRQWDAMERDDVATELERYAALFDANPMRQEVFWKRAGRAVFDDWNSFLESWGKIAGDRYLEGQGITGAERVRLVRERAGSPDFLARGQGTKWLNSIFMFSNARAQGLRQTVGAFKDNPVSTSIKFAMFAIAPSLLMNAMAKGLLGDDDEEKNWLKQAFDCIGEFDKRNYLCIPLWSDGKRTGYTRIPMDHTGQVVHTALWDALNSKDPAKVTDALGQVGGQFPWTPGSLTPVAKLVSDLAIYGAGINPQDTYRGQPAINQTVFAAGGMQSHVEMAKYEWNSGPGGSLYRFDPPFDVRSKTALDKAFSFPGLAQFKRFYKETDQGIGDAERFAEQAKSAGNAQRLMSAKDVAAAAISGAETRQEAMRLLGKSYRDARAADTLPSPKDYKFTQYREVYKNMVDKRFGEAKR